MKYKIGDRVLRRPGGNIVPGFTRGTVIGVSDYFADVIWDNGVPGNYFHTSNKIEMYEEIQNLTDDWDEDFQ